MTSYRLPLPYDRPPPGRRASGLGLAIGVNLLVLLVLLGLNAPRTVPMGKSGSILVDLLPDAAASEERSASAAEADAPPETRRETPPVAQRPPPPTVIPPVEGPPLPDRPLAMIEVGPDVYLASDIGKLPRASADSGPGSDSRDSEEAGRGPQGQILYNAEWARRPTDAELGGYLPRNAPEGWGLIACRTVPGHRVDDCIELDNHPRGSRLASAVRQAAWQFRVRPPRKNGREMVGEWVQIRIDYLRPKSK